MEYYDMNKDYFETGLKIVEVVYNGINYRVGDVVIHKKDPYTKTIHGFCFPKDEAPYKGQIWFYFDKEMKNVADLINFRKKNKGDYVKWDLTESI